ncbi:hypothetical protein VKT23_014250 [Stygiomarasmius scandens]
MKREIEDRRYIEALEKEMTERQDQEVLETSIQEAGRLKSELLEKKDRLHLSQLEIERLYERVFDGTRREFPRDQQLKQQLEHAQSAFDTTQARLTSNSAAIRLLSQADAKIQDSLRRTAHDEYHGLFNNTRGEKERKLKKAAKRARESQEFFRKARAVCLEISSLPALPINAMYTTAKYFDSPLLAALNGVDTDADLAKYRAILAQVMKLLRSELQFARERVTIAKSELPEASEVLSDCKEELQTFRQVTFESIVANPNNLMSTNTPTSSGEPSDSLPSYAATAQLETLPTYHSLVDE